MLDVNDLWKSYDGQPLLCGLTFTVAEGETVCLLGASGSGKSTLLRLIAGLETPERGSIRWEAQDLSGVPAHARAFGLVFQDYALFPHLNVAENVAFGLKMQDLPREAIRERVEAVLGQVNLAGFAGRRVNELSGGEQQRVALARALAPRPRLLMFDEPLGALDRNLRTQLMEELRGILHTSRVPAVYVTHDQEEAFTLADRVLLLHEGRIVRSGTPRQVWGDPGSAWAARFLGVGTVVEGVVRPDGKVDTPAGVFAPPCGHDHRAGEHVPLLLRPGGAKLVDPSKAEGDIRGVVVDVAYRQEDYRVTLANGVFFFLPDAPAPGDWISLELPPAAIQCLG